jgi:hypothetical protein
VGEAASVEEVSGYSIKLVKMLSGWREVGLPCHRHRSQPPPKPKLKETKTLEAEKDDMDIVSENLKTHSDRRPLLLEFWQIRLASSSSYRPPSFCPSFRWQFLKETKTLEAEKDDMDIVSENLKTHSDKIATEKRGN